MAANYPPTVPMDWPKPEYSASSGCTENKYKFRQLKHPSWNIW